MEKENPFNPLDGWTKEQIKSALKAHSKTELLKIAIQWRMESEFYKHKLEELNK
tara:strand:- start:264 stop:425 length:162 start_codon:yes stop_codon:yes gene_type:complete